MTARIALVHATSLAMAPINSAFRQAWPEAHLMNLLDDSLASDLASAGGLNEALVQRFQSLARYAVATGADAVVFTCSAFGPAIEAARAVSDVPTLKPNEPMFQQAIAIARAASGAQGQERREGRVGLVTTFAPAMAAMRAELLAQAGLQGVLLAVQDACVPEAMAALNAGNAAEHDRLVALAAAGLHGCDVILLGQFSMARAWPVVSAQVACPVLTSPAAAVADVRRQLAGLPVPVAMPIPDPAPAPVSGPGPSAV